MKTKEELNQNLINAITNKNLDEVSIALKEGADPREMVNGKTAMQFAINWNYITSFEIINSLLDAGAEIKNPEEGGEPYLNIILQKTPDGQEGVNELITKFVEKGASLYNKENGGDGPISIALSNDKMEIFKFMLNMPSFDINKDNLLTKAITQGKVAVIPLLIEKGANVNPDDRENNPLVQAIRNSEMHNNMHEIVDLLIENKAKINPEGEHLNNTPLIAAIQKGNKELALKLLELGAEVNPTNLNIYVQTPLVAAINSGTELVLKLLDAGAEINPTNTNHLPFSHSVYNSDIFNILIDLKNNDLSEVSVLSALVQFSNLSMIHEEAKNNINRLLDLIVEREIDIHTEIKYNAQSTSVLAAILNSPMLNEYLLSAITHKFGDGIFAPYINKDYNGSKPIFTALQNGSVDLFNSILNIKNIDLNTTNHAGKTSLEEAITLNKVEAVKKIYEFGAKLPEKIGQLEVFNSQLIEVIKQYQPAIDIVSHQNEPSFVPNNLNNNQPQFTFSNFQVEDKSSSNLSEVQKLCLAIMRRNVHEVQEILKKGINVDNLSDNEIHPLVYAVSTGNTEITKLLLETGMDCNVQIPSRHLPVPGDSVDSTFGNPNFDLWNKHIIFSALREGREELVQLLLKYGAYTPMDFPEDFIANSDVIDSYICTYNPVAEYLANIDPSNLNQEIFKEQFDKLVLEYPKQVIQSTIRTGGQKLLKALDDNYDFDEVKKILATKAIKYHAKYKSDNGEFIITPPSTKDESFRVEKNKVNNKERSETYFKDGKVYSKITDQEINNIENHTYVVSKTGKLYINYPINGYTENMSNYGGNHSFFLKGKPNDALYGYGKPVACGGHITFNEEGKVTNITNGSGHYAPIDDQLKVVTQYLARQDILDDDFKIGDYQGMQFNKNDFLDSDMIGDVLASYTEVHY